MGRDERFESRRSCRRDIKRMNKIVIWRYYWRRVQKVL
jgi:hypothetical protein